MGKRQGESIYNINNIVIHTSVAKIEKLQYKDIITPRYSTQLPPQEFCIHTHTQTHKHTPDMAKKQNGSQNYPYSWRVTDPSSAIHEETEDEEGQVEPGTFGASVCS